MHTQSLETWRHDHSFGQEIPRAGERRTLWVTVLTLATMAIEIAAGVAFGSMALLADGLHMGSHAFALGLAYAAYAYARRHASDRRFSFGTGKLNALAGYTSAVILAALAALMAGESLGRFFDPVTISYTPAIGIAVLGLIVNLISAILLGGGHADGHHDHDHDEEGDHHYPARPSGRHDRDHGGAYGHDHNLRAAYLHVIADAATSVLAIVALVAGKYLGVAWLDPLMGIAGAVLILVWSVGLLRDSGAVLVDRQAADALHERVRSAIETADDARVADLHLWSIGAGGYAAAIIIVAAAPLSPDDYKLRLPADAGIVHATIEVHACLAAN